MIFFDYTKELNKDSDLYKFMSSTLQNLYKQLKLQKNKKNNLVSLTDRLSNIDIENSSNINTSSLLSIIEELRTCLDNIRSNIEDINKLIKELQNALDSVDASNNLNSDIDLALFYTLYIEKQNVISEKDLKTEALFHKAYKIANFSEVKDDIDSTQAFELPQKHKNIQESQIEKSTLSKKNDQKQVTDEITNTNQKSVAPNVDSITSTPNASKNKTPKKDNKTTTIPTLEDNNTLIISETQNKVFLPYKISDLEVKLQEKPNKYSSISELIDKEYIFPLTKFKNPSLSRFKEAYSLMKNREKASLGRCLDLAFELTFEYNLNPAVIAACKNLDELDIYLDCLDDKTLDKFNIFNIKYEIPPMVQS